MTIKIKSVVNILPGLAVAFVIAAVAKMLVGLLPVHLIGASVFALFIGILINRFWKPKILVMGLKFTSKKILKFAIVLLGTSLSINTVLTVGKMSLVVMCFTLFTCFGGGYLVGKALKLNWKISNLISAGTGICGGSAIAAIAPVVNADDKDIAYAMSATFLFDMAMIVLFPILGFRMGLSDMAYGLWAGTAVNDTSSVVAAGYAFSESAGDFATMVKLTRTLTIIPTVLIFSLINAHLEQKACIVSETEHSKKNKLKITSLFPWFIVAFVILAIINSFGVIPVFVSNSAKEVSKFLMVAALAAIGMNTSFNDMKKSGIAPLLHGFIISALVVVVALAVEFFMGVL